MGRGVASLAHVGGFTFGAVTARWFEDPRWIALQESTDSIWRILIE
jgi:membrane associated rhomboid family serine protease